MKLFICEKFPGRPELPAPAGQSTKRPPDMAPTPSDNRALSSSGGGQNPVYRSRLASDEKAEHLYSTLNGIQTTLKRSGMDHTDLPAINTIPAFTW